MSRGPNVAAVGAVAAEHLGPLMYALEVCAVAMADAGRADEAQYYRALARRLAEAGGSSTERQGVAPADPTAPLAR